jgi:hypothetical protein
VRDYAQRMAEPAAAIAAAQVASERLAAGVQRLNGVIAESAATERERFAAMLRNYGDARVNDAPEYAEAIYDAESLVRGERPVYALRSTMAAALAAARAEGAGAMRDATVAAVRRRAEELDASVTDEEAADDEEGYGRFQEALELVEVLGALPIPEATNTETT